MVIDHNEIQNTLGLDQNLYRRAMCRTRHSDAKLSEW